MLKVKKGILFCLSIATAGFFVACDDDPSSPNGANPAQENILPEESEKVEVSSSSVKVVPASSAEISVSKPTIPSYTVEKGTMVDERDCRTYKTITIGTQTWMAENLKFEYKVDGVTYGNFCNPDSCETFGRHYTWAAAMDSAVVFTNDSENCGYGVICSPTYPVPGICPEGWHIPDSTEWVEFYKILNEDPHAMQAEDFIRSKSAIRKGLVATNASGFSALYETLSLVSGHSVSGAFFWSSTEYAKSSAYFWHVSESEARLDNNKLYDKKTGMAVRCIKDFGTVVTPSSSCAEEPPVSSVENPVDTVSSTIIKSSSSSQAVKSSSSKKSSKDKGDRMFYLPTLIPACASASLGNARFIECKSPNDVQCLKKINGCNFAAVEYCGCWESEDAYIYYRNKDKGLNR